MAAADRDGGFGAGDADGVRREHGFTFALDARQGHIDAGQQELAVFNCCREGVRVQVFGSFPVVCPIHGKSFPVV